MTFSIEHVRDNALSQRSGLFFQLFLTLSFLSHNHKHACKQMFCCQCFQKPTSFCKSSNFQVQRVQAPLSLLPVLNTCQHLSKHSHSDHYELWMKRDRFLLFYLIMSSDKCVRSACVQALCIILRVTTIRLKALIQKNNSG